MNKLECLVAHINSGRGLNGFKTAKLTYVTRTCVMLSVNGKIPERMSTYKATKLLSNNCDIFKKV